MKRMTPSSPPPDRSRPPRRSEAGFTLLSVILSSTLFLGIGLSAMTMSLTSTVLEKENRQQAVATATMRQLVETVRGQDFDEVFALYNDDPADDPAGAATASSSWPVLERRELLDLEVDVSFPNETGGQLREDLVSTDIDPRLSQLDLDGNGEVGSDDVSGTYKALPVRLSITWGPEGRRRTFTITRILTDRSGT